jgi:hypothetical protein
MAVEANMGLNGCECTRDERGRLIVHAEGCFYGEGRESGRGIDRDFHC